MMKKQTFKNFSAEEHKTWGKLFKGLARSRREQAHPLFTKGVEALGLDDGAVPNLDEVNDRLQALTGWRGIPVEGLEENDSFFTGMERREFPIGNFIRSAEDVNYTPAPDVFHDLYGHLPLLADPHYADFCQRFGAMASKYLDNSDFIEQFGRLFWFGVEFPLIKYGDERRIFGGGILSSAAECDYCLSERPEVAPFDIEEIRRRKYHIDDFQVKIYLLDTPEQLYTCLGAFEEGLRHLSPQEELDIIRSAENISSQHTL